MKYSAYHLINLECTIDFVIIENIRQVCLLYLTADFGVKTSAKIVSCETERAKLVFRAVCTH